MNFRARIARKGRQKYTHSRTFGMKAPRPFRGFFFEFSAGFQQFSDSPIVRRGALCFAFVRPAQSEHKTSKQKAPSKNRRLKSALYIQCSANNNIDAAQLTNWKQWEHVSGWKVDTDPTWQKWTKSCGTNGMYLTGGFN